MKDKKENNFLENYMNWDDKWCYNTKYIICKCSRNSKKWFFVEGEEEKENEN